MHLVRLGVQKATYDEEASAPVHREDFDDVVLKEEKHPSTDATRWLAIARVHMKKDFNEFWFYKNMCNAWDLLYNVKFRSLDNKLYTMQILADLNAELLYG